MIERPYFSLYCVHCSSYYQPTHTMMSKPEDIYVQYQTLNPTQIYKFRAKFK